MSNSEDKNLISSKELLDKTGISRATLNNYIKMGIIPRPVIMKPGEEFKNIKNLGYFPREIIGRIEEVKKFKKEGKLMRVIAEMIRDVEKDIHGEEDNDYCSRRQDAITDIKRKRSEVVIEEEGPKLTLKEITSPAYLIDFDFKVVWINREAEEKILHQEVRNIRDSDSRNIFKLIFNWEFHCYVKNWKDLVAYHMAFVKFKFSKTWLARLYQGMSGKEASLLEKVYDETSIYHNHVIKDTDINLLRKDGFTDRYHVYSIFFKEGILFVYRPFDGLS